MKAAWRRGVATQRVKSILAPILHGNRNRVEVSLHSAVNLREYSAEFRKDGRILGPRRLGESVARRGKQLDAFLYST